MKKMTEKALSEAFAGESMAHMKYLAFSDKAKSEGFPNMARLFEAISYAERVHATNHARNLGYIGKTADNVQSGWEGENFEIEEMYPAYNAVATLQSEEGAKKSIYYAEEAEKIHRTYYGDAKKTVEKGVDLNIGNVYICPVCGWTHIGDDLPDNCPVCQAPKSKFVKF